MWQRIRRHVTPLGLLDAAFILTIIYIILWSLHPNLVFSSTLLTGGDTGAHLALPAYLRTQGDLFNLTPWSPGWFAGMPAYTYYFVLPDVLATVASYVIGFAVAFKLATILGSVLMPIAAYCMGRLFRAPRPVPLALAMATLPFLFDASYTIDGGNLFSTMAGEYAFSLSLALALVSIGLFARGVRTGRGYWWAAITLSATLASHVLPFFFVVGAVGVLVIFETLQRRGVGDPTQELVPGDYARPWRFALGAGLLSFGLSAWWLLPFVATQNLTNSMGYTNDNVSSLHSIFTTLGWYNATGAAGGDRWVIIMAACAFVAAFAVRDRLGMVLGALTLLSLGAYVLDPQSVIWNERLVPFWFVTIHLSAGWLVGYPLARWSHVGARVRRWAPIATPASDVESASSSGEPDPLEDHPERAAPEGSGRAENSGLDEGALDEALDEMPAPPASGERRARRIVRASVSVAVLGLASTLPGLVPPLATTLGLSTTGNQVSSWAQWNYSGYQSKAAWPEYHDLMTTMQRVADHYGCGRAMWEYSSSENRFGTPMALMLMPYWTNNCVDSMEGLFFESSATTPYHFLNQAELSAAPSNPQVGLNYGQLNVSEGVKHLQMLGVKYYVAFSPLAVAEANGDPDLRFVAATKRWPSPGVQWRVYLIKHSPMVQGVTRLPNVVSGIASRTAWLSANASWWLDPARWSILMATSGPKSWPRVSSPGHLDPTRRVAPVTISDLKVATQSVSFRVSRTGVPVLVKISYYPRWHASGATGPYRVSPNLMVVVPTSKDVSLEYTSTPALTVGNIISDLTVLGATATIWVVLRRRQKVRN